MAHRQCTEEGFLRDVALHTMRIEHDDGVFRCLKFYKPGTGILSFRLTTWPGFLAISGDMGTFVFWRTEDMFTFFRQKPYKDEKVPINVGYWMEKCEAENTRGSGMREFDPERLREQCRDAWKVHFLDVYADDDTEPDSDEAKECWEEIERRVLGCDPNLVRVHDALADFKHGGFTFQDSWEWRLTRPTYHLIWCLYAIAWGIQRYDEAKAPGRPEMSAYRFNAENPIGTPVRYFPIKGCSDSIVTKTRSEAWELGHGEVVVKVDGRSGGVCVSHLEILG